ncbi:MAG: protease, partial [Actinomycetota bacterium]|nr:protease [Actinomycetota bacterium]
MSPEGQQPEGQQPAGQKLEGQKPEDNKLAGKKIAVLIESDFYEEEIFYYERRFPEEGAEVHFMSRMWGLPSITFTGHGYKVPFECHRSFEDIDDAALAEYAAVIVPSAV